MKKNNKTMSNDEIFAEILKIINDDNLDILYKLFNKIYDKPVYAVDWLKSSFIVIPKKRRC